MTTNIVNQGKRRVLVTGANGFVGRVLCGELHVRGFAIRAAVRSVNLQVENAEIAVAGAIDGKTDWNEILNDVDLVVHLAARVHVMRDDAEDALEEYRKVNVAGTEHLARAAARNGVKRLVYVSSIKVNGEATYGDDKFTEAKEPSPQGPYSLSKWEAELALHRVAAETGLEVVIVRTPLVYGPEVKGNFEQMLKVLGKGIPLPLASVANLRSLVYVENLVDALIVCATHPAAVGKTYLVSDYEDISISVLLRQLGEMMESPARLFPCPSAFLKLAGRFSGKTDQIGRLLDSLQIDSSKIRRELNWTPPYTLRQGLQETAEWYRNTHP
jgi:nucleoside-diphosphate-sugar epimerase